VLFRSIGVSNYNAAWTRRAHTELAKRGIPLASNQLKYSLLDRHIERDGTMQACNELNVTIIAYSPIEKGLLTGKYTPTNLTPGTRGRIYNRQYVERIQPLIGLMREIGQAHGGKTPSQVALNWTICKGTVPIPGAKNARQAQENAGAVGWRLTNEEIMTLEKASDQVRN
jgi:aryl-alcohol dehydrogenase-like predicted oxidoreductase